MSGHKEHNTKSYRSHLCGHQQDGVRKLPLYSREHSVFGRICCGFVCNVLPRFHLMKTFRVFLSIFFLIYVFFLQNCMNIIDFNVDLRGYAYRLSLMCTSCFYHAFLLCFCNVHDGEMHTTLSLFSYGLLCAYFSKEKDAIILYHVNVFTALVII